MSYLCNVRCTNITNEKQGKNKGLQKKLDAHTRKGTPKNKTKIASKQDKGKNRIKKREQRRDNKKRIKGKQDKKKIDSKTNKNESNEEQKSKNRIKRYNKDIAIRRAKSKIKT